MSKLSVSPSSPVPKITVSYKIPKNRKKEVDETLNNIADSDPTLELKGDYFLRLIEYYNSSGNFFKIDIDDPTIRDVINEVFRLGCGYLKYESESENKFQCYETMMSKKKPTPLSDIPERTLHRCIDCIKGKEELKQRQYEKKLEKDMIKKILNFRSMLMSMVGDGFFTEVFFCMGDVRDNQAVFFSRDNIMLPCPENEMELVKIDKVCMNTVNPKTDTTPCRYLIKDQHIAKLKKKHFTDIETEFKEVQEILPELEHQETIEAEVIEPVEAESNEDKNNV